MSTNITFSEKLIISSTEYVADPEYDFYQFKNKEIVEYSESRSVFKGWFGKAEQDQSIWGVREDGSYEFHVSNSHSSANVLIDYVCFFSFDVIDQKTLLNKRSQDPLHKIKKKIRRTFIDRLNQLDIAVLRDIQEFNENLGKLVNGNAFDELNSYSSKNYGIEITEVGIRRELPDLLKTDIVSQVKTGNRRKNEIDRLNHEHDVSLLNIHNAILRKDPEAHLKAMELRNQAFSDGYNMFKNAMENINEDVDSISKLQKALKVFGEIKSTIQNDVMLNSRSTPTKTGNESAISAKKELLLPENSYQSTLIELYNSIKESEDIPEIKLKKLGLAFQILGNLLLNSEKKSYQSTVDTYLMEMNQNIGLEQVILISKRIKGDLND